MKKFIVDLTKKINGVPFGTSRTQTRETFGAEFKEMKKAPTSRNTMDVYKSCEVFYTADNKLEAVEFFIEEAAIIVEGEKVPTDYEQCVEWLKALDSDIEENDDGIISKKCGVSIYAPDKKIETILFATAQYF